MGFSFKDFWEDTEDFFSEDIPEAFQEYVLEELLKDSVKYTRLRGQALVIMAIKRGEEALVAAALGEIEGTGIPPAVAEKAIRDMVRGVIELIKKETGADWLIDT